MPIKITNITQFKIYRKHQALFSRDFLYVIISFLSAKCGKRKTKKPSSTVIRL